MTGTLPDTDLPADVGAAEIVVPEDPFDVRLALGATGALRAFNRAGVLSAADVHVAIRLAELGDEPDELVRLAIAFAVRGVRSGSVCVDLAQVRHQLSQVDPDLPWPNPGAWEAAVLASPLVGPGKPLRWEYGLLYLDRYRRQEEQARRDLLARHTQPAAGGGPVGAGRRTAAPVPRE